MRVPAILADRLVAFETMIHPPAFTAQKRAKYLHVPGAQVAKCVLLKGPAGYLLAVLPATRQVDTELLAKVLGGPVRLATTSEVGDAFPDCEWGMVPPFGTPYGMPTLLDDSLSADDAIVLEVNSRWEAIRLRCRDFEELEKPTRLVISH